jgi:hypothetical protein
VKHLGPIAAAAALLSVAPAASTGAQPTAPLAAGERVRVVIATGRPARHTGTVTAVRADTLVLNRRNSEPITVSLASVAQVERSLGPGRCAGAGARVRCMLRSGVAGTVLGAAIGYFGTQGAKDMPGVGVILGAPVGLIVGLVVGGLVGGERWERVR